MSPRIVAHQGIWEPCLAPQTNLRKLGVPQGGFWDSSFPAAIKGLGEPVLWGTAAAPGGGPVLSLISRERLLCIVMGSPGLVRTGSSEEKLPCLWVGEGAADLESDRGGRWSIAAFASSAAPLLRSPVLKPSQTPVEIRVIPLPGCEVHLAKKEWMISPSSSRIGIRLLGPSPNLGTLESSRPSAPGIIQAAGSGELLVHGPDGPTTGGYPQLGAVIKADLGRLSELPPGANVAFCAVTKEEARTAWIERLSQAEELASTLSMLRRLGLV